MAERRLTPAERGRFAGVRRWFDNFLSGPTPSDPLYLSNRTWQQKLRLGALIGAPVLVVLLVMVISATDLLHWRRSNPYEHAAAEQNSETPAGRTQPAPPVRDPAAQALEVSNLRIVRGVEPPVVTGEFRNNTGRSVHSAEITYLLADNNGSVLATESTQVQEVGPHRMVTFRAPLKLSQADYVVMRDVREN